MSKLGIEDFVKAGVRPALMELKTKGNMEVWYYLGNNLDECVRAARVTDGTTAKFYDPITKRPEGSNMLMIDSHMVLLLTSLCQLTRCCDKETFKFPSDFPKICPRMARGFTTNYAYLVHFGLLEREKKGVYRVTQAGFDFFDGKKPVSNYVICNEETVMSLSNEKNYIDEFLSDIEDIRNEPLWWENWNDGEAA